mgnify:FL=1
METDMGVVFLILLFVVVMLINSGVLYVAVKMMDEPPAFKSILIIGLIITIVGIIPGFPGMIAAAIVTLILLYKFCDIDIIPDGFYILVIQGALNYIAEIVLKGLLSKMA